jgi:hypothetical protein
MHSLLCTFLPLFSPLADALRVHGCVVVLCRGTVSWYCDHQVRPYAKEFMAAAIIVAAARRKLAWGRLRATRNWRAFNTLDNNDEHRQLMRRSRMLSRQPALRVIAKKASVEDVMSIVTEPSYDGSSPATSSPATRGASALGVWRGLGGG